jgi:uncharacterized protein YdhG (YjbR/CyaY superfamily)
VIRLPADLKFVLPSIDKNGIKMKPAVNTKFKTVDEYIAIFPEPAKALLETMRKTIRQAAPQAEELISYNMPAYKLNGILVYYAGYRMHIGFYPTGSGIKAFQKDLAGYEGSKGTVRFPLDKPLPLALISRMVKFRVRENLEKAKLKNKK